MKVIYIIKSWDIWLSVVVSIIIAWIFPKYIDINFAKDTYFIGISILAIIFAIFFASLAIIMSSSHDDFVSFLEEDNHYTAIIGTFRFTLLLLFFALLLSIILYVYTSYSISQGNLKQTKWLFIGFTFLSLYSLFAVFMSTRDTINYSKYRSKFIELHRKQNRE